MKTYILDALNVINYSPTLRQLLNISKENSVSALCSELSTFLLKYPSYKCIVVVDGNLQSINKYNQNISLVESQNNTADDKIKEIFSKITNKNNIVIVSTDTEVYNFARMNATDAMTSNDFLNLISDNKKHEPSKNKAIKGNVKNDKPKSASKKDINFFKELFSNDDFDLDL